MKRSELVRKRPMAPAGKAMKRSTFKRRAPKRRAGHDSTYLAACRGQRCYLAITGICSSDRSTVVPAHRNEGKGMGLKVPDILTVPACFACHHQYDQGGMFTREQKRAFWNDAYARWSADRDGKQDYQHGK